MIIKKDPEILKSYLEDSSNISGGNADSVVIPESLAELSAYLRDANLAGRPVTVSGGGTGTTGSRIPFGGSVVSLEKFNRIVKVSKEEMCAVAGAGVFVEDLKRACDAQGLFYTSHPTEKTASVGGTVATNASGARSFKYGPTRKYVRRLKMVLPDGQTLDLGRGQRFLTSADNIIELAGGAIIRVPMPGYRMPEVKNAAGYFARDGMDLIDLFIGQEGTLSIITEIELGVEERPERIFSAFAFFKAEPDSWAFAAEARNLSKKSRAGISGSLIDALSIEYFDINALSLLRDKNPNVPENAAAAIFFEQEISPASEDEIVNEWLTLLSAHGASADDTWVAMTDEEAEKFSQLRYAIPESVNDIIRRRGIQKISTDIAVPDSNFTEMMEFYRGTLRSARLDHVIFGHIGESHVHVNILPNSEAQAAVAGDIVMKFVRKGVGLGGTVSAEHGIGKIKHRYLEEMYGKEGILEMARIKKAFDPNSILGLNNIFPKEALKLV